MTGHWNRFAAALSMGVLLGVWSVSARGRQASQPPGKNPPPTRAQSAPPADAGAQIDALVKKEIELTNTQGRPTETEALAEQAVALSRKLGDKQRLMHSLDALASAYGYNGRLTDSLDAARQEAALARELQDKFWLCRSFNNSATVLRELGRSEEALGYFNQGVALARQINNPVMLWALDRNVGVFYYQLGEADRAGAPLQESLGVARQLNEEPWKTRVKGFGKTAEEASLESLGNWEIAREDYAAAVNYFQQSLASNPGVPGFKAEILMDLAVAHQQLGNWQKSAELLEHALELSEKSSAPNPILESDLAYSQEHLGQLEEAFAGEQRALALLHKSGGNPEYEWLVDGRLAHVEAEMGRNEAALADYRKAVAAIENLRAGALNTEFGRAAILESGHATYAEAADLLVAMRREDEGLEMAERGRARAFLDVLAQARAGLADELTADQRHREDAIQARISAAQKALWKENLGPEEETNSKASLASAEADLETLHLEVRQSNPRYASIRYPEPIRASAIQDELLDDRTALVEYLLGGKRSLAWVVTKSRVTVTALPAQKDIQQQVATYRQAIAGPVSGLTLNPSLAEVRRLGAELYRSIFQPLEPALAGSGTLIVVPDGTLNYLPFEALVSDAGPHRPNGNGPDYLAGRFAIVYAPSGSALVTVRALNREAVAPGKTLLAFGDPVWAASSGKAPATASDEDTRSVATPVNAPESVAADFAERGFSFARLPYSREEVLEISRLFPASKREVFLGREATESALKAARTDDFRYLHFATHGFIDQANPGRSGILLSRAPGSAETGILQMDEIMRMKLNAELVTLSACSTGLGKLETGEGMLGLTRAFFYAGARNVTVSLWNVNDSASAALMRAFYENLKHGLPEGVALRQAKLSLIHGKTALWRHPYFWAGFVLVGRGN